MTTTPSKLDYSQVLQNSYDEDLKSLRVSSSATVVPGSFDVAISATEDTIAIADANTGTKVGVTNANELKVTDANSILPSTPTIYNAVALTANTEYNYNYPSNTKKIYIKARHGILRIAYTVNGTITNANILVAKGASYCLEGVKTSATVYFSTSYTNDTIEFETWA